MKPTQQQKEIIEYDGDRLLVEAGPGAGKSSVIFQTAKAHSKEKILYVVFGKRDKESAIAKAKKLGISNMEIVNIHSLAHSKVMKGSKYNLEANLQPSVIIDNIPKLKSISKTDKVLAYTIARHAIDLLKIYFSNTYQEIKEIDPSDFIMASSDYIQFISDSAQTVWDKIREGDIPQTHDSYLKMYALTGPILKYDRIFGDEFTDQTNIVVDLLSKQNTKRMFVFDTFQSLYGFRGVYDSTKNLDWPTLPLTHSFRFHPEIAKRVNEVKEWYKLIEPDFVNKYPIIGAGKKKNLDSKEAPVFIARSNATLLSTALQKISDGYEYIHYVGKLNSILFGQVNVYDIYNLYKNNKGKIQDPFISSFKDLNHLKEHVEETKDREMERYIKLVERYTTRLPGLIKQLKDSECAKNRAELIMSSAHRYKGEEADVVTVASDFITPKILMNEVKNLPYDKKEREQKIRELKEDINMRYVAVSRPRQELIEIGKEEKE